MLRKVCRSPMAEFLLRDMARKRGVGDCLFVASAGVSDEEHGAPVYPPVRKLLEARGISCREKRARKIERADYERFDYIFGMTQRHCNVMTALFGGDPQGKVMRLLDMTDKPGDVDDPWYTGKFAEAAEQIDRACADVLQKLLPSATAGK